jgi:hypothetical protein
MNRSTLLLLVALVLAAFGHAADNSEAIIQATKDYVKKIFTCWVIGRDNEVILLSGDQIRDGTGG